MKKELDIYGFPKRIESAVRKLNEAEISERNKQIIFEFRDFCSLDGMSIGRIERYLTFFLKMEI